MKSDSLPSIQRIDSNPTPYSCSHPKLCEYALRCLPFCQHPDCPNSCQKHPAVLDCSILGLPLGHISRLFHTLLPKARGSHSQPKSQQRPRLSGTNSLYWFLSNFCDKIPHRINWRKGELSYFHGFGRSLFRAQLSVGGKEKALW